MIHSSTVSNVPIVLKLKRENATTPWGLKFQGGEGTGKQLEIMVIIKHYICIRNKFISLTNHS